MTRSPRDPAKTRLLATLALLMMGVAFSATPAQADDDALHLYSYRQAFLMQPLLDAFTSETGTQVRVVYAKSGFLQRLKAEGANSPADVVLTADITRADELARAGLLQPIQSDVLGANIPAQYRSAENLWFGLTMRARVIYADKTRVAPGEITSYEDLADPKFKDRVCIRSGKHEYNISLLASVIAAQGDTAAETWLRGLKDNLARRPQGNDRAQVRAIYEGECDVSVGNSYYFGKMLTNDDKPQEKDWANAVTLIFPNQGDRGTHVNVSTAAVTKASKNVDMATGLIEFLASDTAQAIYAAQNFEYPVKAGVALHPMVQSWGDFKADAASLDEIARLHTTASKMMDKVAFDH